MKTFFADPERFSGDKLNSEIDKVSNSVVINNVMDVVNGLFAVLNSKRQIIALNNNFLKMLGINDTEKVLGLRLGEAVECVHAYDMPGGCGTSQYCSSCKAAIAMVTALNKREAKEKCFIEYNKDDNKSDIYLEVHARPFTIYDEDYILLFMRDITKEQNWASLEHIFFHDMKNILTALIGLSSLEEENNETVREIRKLSERMSEEIEIQQFLHKHEVREYKANYKRIKINRIKEQLETIFARNPIYNDVKFEIKTNDKNYSFECDESLLLRIIINMVKNAMEASEKGGVVKLNIVKKTNKIEFRVWNNSFIKPKYQRRIFQKNFSTKEQMGRGIGTFSMKLLGEEILEGKVSFRSDVNLGTEFVFEFPFRN